MENLVIKLECQSCRAAHVLTLNTYTAKHQWKLKPVGTYLELWAIVEHYKKLKGYDKMPTWDREYKGRALKCSGKIYRFFDQLGKPVSVAKEMMDDINQRAKREGWNWNLETIRKLADSWLADKQKEKQKR